MSTRYEAQPYHMDDYGGRHYPPQPKPQVPSPSTGRPRHPRYDGVPDKDRTAPPPAYHASYPLPRNAPDRRRPRANTYRPPPPPSSSSSSASPQPRRAPPRRSPRNHERSPPEEDYYAPRRRRHREEDYFSDNRHDRRHPHRRERDVPRERDDGRERRAVRPHPEKEADEVRRSGEGRPVRPRPEKKGSKWQQEGKKLFNEYAVPAIKAEGTKYISKQLGNILAKGISS